MDHAFKLHVKNRIILIKVPKLLLNLHQGKIILLIYPLANNLKLRFSFVTSGQGYLYTSIRDHNLQTVKNENTPGTIKCLFEVTLQLF